MTLIKALWHGDISLAKTYWLFSTSIILLLAISMQYFIGSIYFYVFAILIIIYAPFIFIAIWRSANKYNGAKTWAILAKISVILSWIRYIKLVQILGIDIFVKF